MLWVSDLRDSWCVWTCFQTPHLRWAPAKKSRRCGQPTCQAASTDLERGKCWQGFLALCECQLWNLHFHLERKNSLSQNFLSQNFLVEQQFLRSVVLYDCNLFTSFLYAEHQWEFWELCAKITRSKMFTMTLYENFFGMTDDNKSLPWLLRQKSQHINSQCRCF